MRNREPFINGDLTKEPCYTIIRIKAKLLGADENLAEFQARQIKQAIEVATSKIENKDLTTKQDIKLAIAHLKHDTLRFVVWTGVAVIVTLGSMLANGFH